jgi:hypothetical protein
MQVYDEYLDKLKATLSSKLNEDCLYVPNTERSISKYESDTNKEYFTYEIGKMPNGEEVADSYCSSSDTESISSK